MTFDTGIVIQLIAYAVLVTAVIVNTRGEAKRNAEVIAGLQQWLIDHAASEKADLNALDTKFTTHARENVKAHSEIVKELGRLGGKIDNGGRI